MKVIDFLQVAEVKEVWFLRGPNNFDKYRKDVEKWGAGYWDAGITQYLDKEICRLFVMSNGIVRIDCK